MTGRQSTLLALGEAGGEGGEEDEDEEGGAGAGRGRPVAEVIIATPTVRQALQQPVTQYSGRGNISNLNNIARLN